MKFKIQCLPTALDLEKLKYLHKSLLIKGFQIV
jgi:hypothetical protein